MYCTTMLNVQAEEDSLKTDLYKAYVVRYRFLSVNLETIGGGLCSAVDIQYLIKDFRVRFEFRNC